MDKRTIEQILKINRRFAQLIEENASLIEYPLPKTFEEFLVHQRGLEDLWDIKVDADPGKVPPFPNEIDRDIERTINGIRAGLRSLDVEPILVDAAASTAPTGSQVH